AKRLALLLAAGANPHEVADNGRNLMAEAARSGDPERIRLLLQARVSPQSPAVVPKVDRSYRRKWPPANPSGHSSFNIPLMQAAEGGSSECVRLLLEAGASVEERDFEGRSALYAAANPEVASLLIDYGFDPNDLDLWQRVIWRNLAEIAVVLLEKGASPNLLLKHWSLAHGAAFEGSLETLRVLIDHGADLRWRTEWGAFALFAAAWASDSETENHEKTLRYLVSLGLDVNKRKRSGQTPLHEAAWGDGGAPVAIRTLLELGADPDPVDGRGVTPLMKAADFGEEDCVRLLLQAGANPDRIGVEELTAKGLAERHRDIWISLFAKEVEPEAIDRARDALEQAERSLALFP
ncbi:hypothetical protein EON81_25240, partial [bacterium]